MAAGALPAAAHANYVRSNPGADARLVKPPIEIRVVFSEPPDPRGSTVQVFDLGGQRVDLNDTTASGESNGLRVGVKPIGDGGYTVAWSTLSAVDGHETKGTFAFAVGNGPLPALPDVVNASPPPSPLELLGRTIGYAGIALALGAAYFALRVHAPTGATELRRERQLLLVAAGLLVVGSLLLVADQGGRLPPRLALFLGVRALAGLAIAAAAAAPFRATTRRDVVFAAALAAALTATLVSHATAIGDGKDMVLDLVHVAAVSIWSGGVVALLWIVLLRADRDDAMLARIAWRFSLTALVAVAVLVTTGTLQSLDRLVLVQDLVETPYGIALLAKILLLAIALSVGALNLLRYGPRADRRALVRGTVAETGLLAAVMVAAAVLTASAPPAQSTGAAFDETQRVSGYRVELVVPTATPGRSRFVLRVHQGLTPVTGAQKVALRFTMVEHDMGQSELIADERAPGEYVATGSPVAMFGTWKVQAIVRLAGRDDVDALFTVPIAGTQTASAVALTAGQFNLVVFPDPTVPIEGAPIALSIVVIDKQGNPVIGHRITGTLSGSAGQAALPSALTATEAGSGRYRIDIAALAKGTWTAKIAIDGPENSADYGFEVSP
ncbi:MAG TPA: copper resistance protein CopC [Candidatus Limnocylindria bacterium]|nr:copper resistance protein CopC [Candidatus Limnocylindria bacterium]